MSASPPKDLELEVGAQSSDDMERDQGESSQQPSGFDFEVKEQDRWLPIANGVFTLRFPHWFLPKSREYPTNTAPLCYLDLPRQLH